MTGLMDPCMNTNKKENRQTNTKLPSRWGEYVKTLLLFHFHIL